MAQMPPNSTQRPRPPPAPAGAPRPPPPGQMGASYPVRPRPPPLQYPPGPGAPRLPPSGRPWPPAPGQAPPMRPMGEPQPGMMRPPVRPPTSRTGSPAPPYNPPQAYAPSRPGMMPPRPLNSTNGYPSHPPRSGTPSYPLSPSVSDTPRSPTSQSGSASGHTARRRQYPDQIASVYTQPQLQAVAPPASYSYGGSTAPMNASAPAQHPQAPQYIVPGEASAPAAAPSPAPPAYSGPGVDGMQNQFAQMGLGTASHQAVPAALLAGPPEIWALEQPPPPVELPPNSALVHQPVLCGPQHIRSTVNCMPNTPALMKKSKLLLGMMFTPFKTPEEGEPPLPVVNEIVRCRRCRTYFNPFVQFTDSLYKWVCNMCHLKNDVPPTFDYDPHSQSPMDRFRRPELNHAVVEYLAPAPYMSRPPQPPVYVFVIDVSFDAISNGSIGVVAQAILESLDNIPNPDGRALVAFLTVDKALQFYSMTPESTEPQMLVVPDLSDPFLPYPNQLLVNLAECRGAVEEFLSRLGEMFRSSPSTGFALGPALVAAKRLIQHIGGKIVVYQSSLPTEQAGALQDREDAKAAGTAKESELLKPATSFYSTFIQQCLGLQISVDFFVFASKYVDLASVIPLAKTSGGSVYMYPSFLSTKPEDVHRVASEVKRFLARSNGWEAVFRIRASSGIRFPAYYGHHFLRSTDLLTLPNVTPDHCYAADVTLENDLSGNMAYFQTALLYTSSGGERRIRVATLALPIVTQMRDLFRGIDQQATIAMLAKKAVDRAVNAKLEDARKAVEGKMLDMVSLDRSELGLVSAGMGQIPVPRAINLLPLLTLGLLKHDALAAMGSFHLPSDLRTYAITQVLTMAPEVLLPYLVARFYALHELPAEAGYPDAQTQLTVLPPLLNLSSEKLVRHGLFLLFTPTVQFMWIGRDIHPGLLQDIFGVSSYQELTSGTFTLTPRDNDMSQRIHAIMARLVSLTRHLFDPTLYLIKEDAAAQLRSMFHAHLTEDKAHHIMSYQQFLSHIREKLQAK